MDICTLFKESLLNIYLSSDLNMLSETPGNMTHVYTC